MKKRDEPNQIYRLKKEEVSTKTEKLLKRIAGTYEVVPVELQQKGDNQSLTRSIKEKTGDNGTTPKKSK